MLRLDALGALRRDLDVDRAAAIADVLIDPMPYRRLVVMRSWPFEAYVQYLQRSTGHGTARVSTMSRGRSRGGQRLAGCGDRRAASTAAPASTTTPATAGTIIQNHKIATSSAGGDEGVRGVRPGGVERQATPDGERTARHDRGPQGAAGAAHPIADARCDQHGEPGVEDRDRDRRCAPPPPHRYAPCSA